MVTTPHLLTSSTKFQNESERSIRNISGETTIMGILLQGVPHTLASNVREQNDTMGKSYLNVTSCIAENFCIDCRTIVLETI